MIILIYYYNARSAQFYYFNLQQDMLKESYHLLK